MKHLNIIISGKVQGVGFRFSARNVATSYGIKGSVKNLYNGDVFIEAEGDEAQLNQFIKWCYNGPGHARIEKVSVEEAKFKGYHFFDIIH